MNLQKRSTALALLLLLATLVSLKPLAAQSPWTEGRYAPILAEIKKTFGPPKGMVRLDPKSRVWADRKKHRVVVDGYVALTSGQLEMFACLAGTKEHESIVAVFCKAHLVHAGLLAVGAQKGAPVKFEPEYVPPTGSAIKVVALWEDKDGRKQVADVRNWIREVGTDDKTLESDFVFAGSTMWTDPDTKEEHYQAEAGDFICVANFTTAMIDVPIRSLQANSLLSFNAFTERIPESGTPVRLVLQVVNPKKNAVPNNQGSGADTASGKQRGTTEFELASYKQLLDGPPVPPEPKPSDDADESARTSSAASDNDDAGTAVLSTPDQ